MLIETQLLPFCVKFNQIYDNSIFIRKFCLSDALCFDVIIDIEFNNTEAAHFLDPNNWCIPMHDYDNVCFANIVQTHTEMVRLFFVLLFRGHQKLFCFFKQEVGRICLFKSNLIIYYYILYASLFLILHSSCIKEEMLMWLSRLGCFHIKPNLQVEKLN